MAEEKVTTLKESFEQQMKDMSRKSVTLTTENSRLASDLEAMRFRADRVGTLESQIASVRTERNEAMKELVDVKSKLTEALDELEKVKLEGHAGGNDVGGVFAKKRADLLAQENRRFGEFKAKLSKQMAEKRRVVERGLQTDEDEADFAKADAGMGGKSTKSKNKWQVRAQSERTLLKKAQTFLESQKRDIRRRQKRLEESRSHWEKDMRDAAIQKRSKKGLSKSKKMMLKGIKRGLQQQANDLNTAIKQLQATEKWLKEREKKVVKLEKMVSERSVMGVNLDETDNLDESSLFGDISAFDSPTTFGKIGGSSTPNTESSDLERLSDELDSDFSNMSMAENATAFDAHTGGWRVKNSRRGKKGKQNPAPEANGGWVPWQWPQGMAAPPQQAWGYGNGNPYYGNGRGFGRVITNDRVLHGYNRSMGPRGTVLHPNMAYYEHENVNSHIEREWMGRKRPQADRMNNPNSGLSNPDIQHRLSIFQNQLKRWSGDQKTAYDAVGEHSKWLKRFGNDMTKFSVYDGKFAGKRAGVVATGSTGALLSPRMGKIASRKGVADIMYEVENSFSNEI